MDEDLVKRARERCIAAHGEQKRHNGAPYWTHGEAVAELLRTRGITNPAMLAAAYLHDVVEDTDVTEADLREEFGPEVVGLVMELTNADPPEGWLFDEKHASLLEHARRMSPRAKLIKLADRLHNLSEMHIWEERKQQRYAKVSLELLDALRPWPNEELAEQVQKSALAFLPECEEENGAD